LSADVNNLNDDDNIYDENDNEMNNEDDDINNAIIQSDMNNNTDLDSLCSFSSDDFDQDLSK